MIFGKDRRPTVDYRCSCAGVGQADLHRSAADRQGIGICSANTSENQYGTSHDGLGWNDHDSLEDRRKPMIELDEEKAIAVGKADPNAPFAANHVAEWCSRSQVGSST